MLGGVELRAHGVELLDAVPLQHGNELRVHQAHTLGEMLLSLLCRGECPLQVVHDRQQFTDEPAPGALARRRRLPRRTLPVVLEISLNPLSELEIVLGLLLRLLLGLDDPLFLVRRILLPGGLAPLVA